MSIREELITEIEGVISSAAAAGYADAGATNDLYENYVWALCVQAARSQGADVIFQTVAEQPATTLRFRTAPGAIYSALHNYTHAVLAFQGCPELEVHVGIKVTGVSRVLHECDVAVIEQEEARLCRANQVHPRASKLLIAAECKFYTSAVQLHLGRGFLGLTSEIHRRERYFVTNGVSSNVTKLISHHKSEWDFGVLPNTPEANGLRYSLARAFRNYKVFWQ
jgi:hypothetical protein